MTQYLEELIETARLRLQSQREGMLRAGGYQQDHTNVESRVVSFNLGRRGGHSTFIQRTSRHGDVILCPRGRIHEDFFKFAGGDAVAIDRIVSYIQGRQLGDVWVDEPMLSIDNLDRGMWPAIVSRMKPDALIIMLGHLPMPGRR